MVIVDYHATDFFPERWFDAVFILRYDALTTYYTDPFLYAVFHRTDLCHSQALGFSVIRVFLFAV